MINTIFKTKNTKIDVRKTHIEFFIDPMSGQVFTHKDVKNYFNRISITPAEIHFKPSGHIRIMQTLLEEFGKCFDNESNLYKKTELIMLSRLLSE